MNLMTYQYPEGIDCVWIASDQDGHLAALVTAGVAPIPIDILNNPVVDIQDIEQLICNLPKITKSNLVIQVPRPDDFIDMAERGFFVYDWHDVHRTESDKTNLYELIATPNIPIQLNVLSNQLADLAKKIKFTNISFTNSLMLDANTLKSVDC